MRKVKVVIASPNYVTTGPEPVCLSGGRFGVYQHVKSKAELEAENRELIKRIDRLEQYIASIKEKGIYITERCWQSDIPQRVAELRKEKQAGHHKHDGRSRGHGQRLWCGDCRSQC